MHGGASPKGEDHPSFKHGRYSQFMSDRMKDKVAAFADADPLDITGEITLLRAVLGNWVETWGDGVNVEAAETTAKLVSEIRAGALAVQKLRSDTAITPAEVMLFLSRFIEAAQLYVPAEHWVDFVTRCRQIFGGNVSPELIDGRHE
jgi:hypothetical protein